MTKKINSKDNFELCLLRHQYLKRTDINPTKEDFKPYVSIVFSVAGKTFSTYKKLFYAVGLDFIDIVRIGETHIVSFLGLFHIEHDSKKFNNFVEAFSDKNSMTPKDADILDKNKAIFTCFIKQRMEELVRICHQKVRNVRGVPMQSHAHFCGLKIPKANNIDVLANFKKHNLKKVDPAIFRSIKKKAKTASLDYDPLCFKFNGLWYLSIPTNYKPLDFIDLKDSVLDPTLLEHNQNPEDTILLSESTKKWKSRHKKFKKISRQDKIEMVRSFIDKNKNNSVFEEEVHIAEKMLARMGE